METYPVFVAAEKNGSACSRRGGDDLPRPVLFFVAAKENSTACYVRRRKDLPRPILISVAATMLLLQCDLFRLQHSRGAQAGTGCHEGGIILSKKPPEWHLSLPQQRYASDSNLCRDRGEWFRLQWSLLQGRFARLQQAGCRQVRQRRQRRVLMRPEAAFPYVFAAEGAQHPLIGRRAERYLATQ